MQKCNKQTRQFTGSVLSATSGAGRKGRRTASGCDDCRQDLPADFAESHAISVCLAPPRHGHGVAIFQEATLDPASQRHRLSAVAGGFEQAPQESAVVPLIVPDPIRSPTRTLQPDTV